MSKKRWEFGGGESAVFVLWGDLCDEGVPVRVDSARQIGDVFVSDPDVSGDVGDCC